MPNYEFSVWSKTGGLVTKTTVSAPGHQSAKNLVQQQYPNMVIRGGSRK